MEVELAAGLATVAIDAERGGRIASLRVDGLELLIGPTNDPLDWGCYPMAPWAGRVRDGRFRYAGLEHQLERNLPPHAIHGTVFDHAWKVEHAEDTDAVLVTDLGAGWPFPGRVVHRIRLREDALELRLEVWAEDEPFPASCGWHPWWRRQLDRGDPLELDLVAGAIWERDADGIPSGELVDPPPGPWDDCFTELAGPPDALRLTPIVVEPGLPLIAEATFAWSLLG